MHFKDWRGILRRQPVQARQVLKKLLDGPRLFTPQDGYYSFEGHVSFAKLVASVGVPISVASPQGDEDYVFNRWTARLPTGAASSLLAPS